MPFLGNTNFLQALGWAVINSLWQMAFCWVIFQVVLSFGIRRSSTRNSLAIFFLVTGFAWFLFTFFSHWVIDPLAPRRTLLAIGDFAPAQNWNEKLEWCLPYASAFYLAMLMFPLWQFFRNYRFVKIIRSQGLIKSHIDLRLFVQKFSERMGIRKHVQLFISELITSPVTVGFLKPVILMPVSAITCLDTKQVEAILLHELSHIRRYDYLVNLFVNVARTILYFNPFVKLFSRVIEREREKSCDEMVIQFQYDRHRYATALLMLEQSNRMTEAMIVAASGRKHDLLHRVEKIMGVEKRAPADLKKLSGLVAGMLFIFALNALFLLGKPVINNNVYSLNTLANPFYHMVSDGEDYNYTVPAKEAVKKTMSLAAIKKTSKEVYTYQSLPTPPPAPTWLPETPVATGYIPAAQKEMIAAQVIELNKEQEDQVQQAMDATRNIIEQKKWKDVEKNVADALTRNEKEELKEKYIGALDKLNWNNLQENMRNSYEKINWDNVNNQLSSAINTMALDSLSRVYSLALHEVNNAERWMKENQTNSIPDTDVKLTSISTLKLNLQTQIKAVNLAKKKKIIHL
jgi:beta-lactamase regulating signal transducer with metallopeptidase domain